MLTLTGYFDESGTHDGSPAVVFAGFLSTPGGWQRLERDWRRALNDFGLPFFRMSSFANMTGDYKGWPEELRRERLQRLLDTISEHVVGSVGCVVPTDLYEKCFSAAGIARRVSGGPYGLAASETMVATATLVRQLPGNPQVAYVLESGAVGRHQATRVFTANLNDPESKEHFRLLSLSFQTKRDSVSLQAADMLAYELYREWPRSRLTPHAPKRYPLTQFAKLPRQWGWMDEDELNKWAYVVTLSSHFGERAPDDD